MSLQTPIVIDNFQKGTASSAHTSDGAFASAQGMDVTSELGVIKVSHVLDKKSGTTITNRPRWIVQDDAGKLYATDLDNKTYVSTDNGGSWSAITASGGHSTGDGNGLAVWKDHLILVCDSTLDGYGPLSGSPAWTKAFQAFGGGGQTLTGATPLAPAFPGLDDILYIGTRNQLMSLSEVSGKNFAVTDSTTWSLNNNALDLPESEEIRTISSSGKNLLLGTITGGGSSGSISQALNIAKVYPWDRSGGDFGLPAIIPERGVRSLKNINGIVYAICGDSGNLYQYNETFLKPLGALPREVMDRTVGENTDVLPQGMDFFHGFLTIFYSGIQGSKNAGVYTWTGTGFVMSHVLSTGNVGNIDSGPIFVPKPNNLLVGWKDNGATAQGIDQRHASNIYGTSSSIFFETNLFEIGTDLQPNSVDNIDIQLARTDSANQLIISYRNNLTESYTALPTISSSIIGSLDTWNLIGGIKGPKIQLKIELGSGSSGNSGNNVTIRSITLS